MEIRIDNIEPYFVCQKHGHYMNIKTFQVVDETPVLDGTIQGMHKDKGML